MASVKTKGKTTPGVITSVQGVPTQSGRTRFAVTFSDGREYSTFKADIAGEASKAAQEQRQVTLDYTRKEDGQYDDYYLDAVENASGGVQVPQTTTGLAAAGLDSLPVQNFGTGPGPREKDDRIVRGNACNAAAAVFTGSGVPVGEFLDYVDVVAHYIKTSEKANAPSTPQEVAAGISGIQVGVQQPQTEGLVNWGGEPQS